MVSLGLKYSVWSGSSASIADNTSFSIFRAVASILIVDLWHSGSVFVTFSVASTPGEVVDFFGDGFFGGDAPGVGLCGDGVFGVFSFGDGLVRGGS